HPAPKGAHLPLFEWRDVRSLKHDLAFGRLHETKDCPSQGRLAGTGFPDETVDLAAVNVQGNPVDRVDEFLCSGQEPRKAPSLDGKTDFEALERTAVLNPRLPLHRSCDPVNLLADAHLAAA